MKLRIMPVFIVALIPLLALTWAVSAQSYQPPANAAPTSPTASPLDVVLIIDASPNQAADPPSMAAYNGHSELGCDIEGFGAIGGDYARDLNACVKACNDNQTCYPFQTVQDAAKAFIDRLRPGYDRVAVIAIDREIQMEYSLGQDFTAAKAAIDNTRVSDHQYYITSPGEPCPYYNIGGERWKCTTSNTGGAIQLAVSQLFTSTNTKIAILLATSSPAATNPFPSPDPDIATFGFCPNKDSEPLCRDNQWATHRITISAQFDAEDYAWNNINYLGITPGVDYSWLGLPNGGLGAHLFSIGLGRRVVCTGQVDSYYPGPPVVCVPSAGNPYVDPGTGYPNGAEQFLRYVATVGDDGNPDTDPCAGAALGMACGNYYFASNGSAAATAYQDIADRLFGTVDFSATPLWGPASLTVTFTDQSVGDILSRTWDFGDTITSTAINPAHTYAIPGLYTVTLQINTAISESVVTRTNYITVYTPVSADFNATPLTGTYPLTVTFTNQSSGDYTESLWHFGDGFTSTLSAPEHVYTSNGTYTVTLQVAGPGGMDQITRTQLIQVDKPIWKSYLPLLLR